MTLFIRSRRESVVRRRARRAPAARSVCYLSPVRALCNSGFDALQTEMSRPRLTNLGRRVNHESRITRPHVSAVICDVPGKIPDSTPHPGNTALVGSISSVGRRFAWDARAPRAKRAQHEIPAFQRPEGTR